MPTSSGEDMVGLVVVSHSHALATAAVGLAEQMVDQAVRPQVRVAAGLDETTLGTDATAISAALEELEACSGILVLVDLGSAVLSSEMAVDFLDPTLAERVRISSAPLVEGLLAAMVSASAGAELDRVATEAEAALGAKREQLQAPGTDPAPAAATGPDNEDGTDLPPGGELQVRLRLGNPHGLHARPAAALVGAIAGLDAQVVAARGNGPAVDARSMTALGGLGVRGGDELRLVAHGPEALLAVQRLLELATDDFGEDLTAAEMDDELDEAQAVEGRVHHLDQQVDASGYAALAEPEAERARLLAATDAVDALLLELDGPGVQGQVMHALRGLLHDPGLVGALRTAVLGGTSSARAVAEVYDRQVDVFASMDNPYLRERATDLRLLRRLLLAGLLGRELTLPELAPDSLLVVDELDAVTAAQLDPETCGGVVVLRAGRAGHGVEVATARGIAVVDGHREAAGWPEGGHAHLSLEV